MRRVAGLVGWCGLVSWAVVAGCGDKTGSHSGVVRLETDAGTSSAVGGAGGSAGGPGGGAGSVGGPLACSDLFDPTTVTDYQIEMTADDWSKISNEFFNYAALEAAGQPYDTYHPIVFHYGSETVTNAMIRLKGQSSWRHTVALDGANAKMQFVIAFDQVDDGAKFHGVSKIVLDMPRDDETFLQERLAYNVLPAMLGQPAPCANNGTITINGALYGLYSNEEHAGHDYLKRVYPGYSGGDLFKGARRRRRTRSTPT